MSVSDKKYWKKRIKYYEEMLAMGSVMTSELYVKGLKNIVKIIKKEENNLSDKKVQKKVIDKIKKEIDRIKKLQLKIVEKVLSDGYKGFYNLAGEGMKGVSISFNAVDKYMVREAILMDWSGRHFSDRLWDDKKLLVKTLEKEFKDSIKRGDSVEKMANRLSNRMDVSANASRRLIATELTVINSKATKDRYEDLGVKRYKFEAFIDEKTTPECRKMNGKIIEVKDGEIGNNMPPLHPWCRSCVVPVLDDEEEE